MNPIYLDYAATTPIDRRVSEKMHYCLIAEDAFGNPASQHHFGKLASELVFDARQQVAALINADASEVIWTSGGTEANNLAIKGVASLYQNKGKHIITMKTEHKSVLDPCQYLEKQGFSVTYLSPEANGLLNIDKLIAAIREDTILVSIMLVNNETGVVQDISAIADLTSTKNIFLHVDAAQAAGKISIDVKKLPIDLLSLCAHKLYGPKGIGALYLRRRPRVRVEPLIHGGGHEFGMRSGTLPTHQIVGMGEACRIAKDEMQLDAEKLIELRTQFLQSLAEKNITLNSDVSCSVPHIINVRFNGMLADAILNDLPIIAASTASACQGTGTEGSYVLRAMGLTHAEIKSSIRFSLGKFTSKADIEQATSALLRY